MRPLWMPVEPCCFSKVGGAGVGALGTSDLGPFTEGISICERSWEVSEGITHSFCNYLRRAKICFGSLSECAFSRKVCVGESPLGPGVDLRQVEGFHRLRGCCIPPW